MSSETPELQPAECPASPTQCTTPHNNNNTHHDSDHDESCSTDDDDASRTVVVVQKYSTLNDMQQQQQSTNKRPHLRRSVSLDERSTINNSKISFTDDPQQPADDSQIAVDRLSKRFSGGHYGSAGGLIASTLNQQDYHDDEEEDDEGEDAETIESESVALATPPSHSLADYPSSKNDKVQVDDDDPTTTTTTTTSTQDDNNTTKPEEFDRIASETARRIWEQDTTVYEDWEHVAEWIGNGYVKKRRLKPPAAMRQLMHTCLLLFSFFIESHSAQVYSSTISLSSTLPICEWMMPLGK